MAVLNEQRLITPISPRQFELYALSLDHGPNLDPAHILGAYHAGCGCVSGCILRHPGKGTFTSLALRRRVDHRWVKVDERGAWPTPDTALDHLSISMRSGGPPEPQTRTPMNRMRPHTPVRTLFSLNEAERTNYTMPPKAPPAPQIGARKIRHCDGRFNGKRSTVRPGRPRRGIRPGTARRTGLCEAKSRSHLFRDHRPLYGDPSQ